MKRKLGDWWALLRPGDVLVVLSNTSLTLEILNSEAELAEKQNILRNTLISMEQEKLSLRQDKAQLDLDVSRKKRAWQQNEELYRNALIAREEWLQSKEDYELAEKKRELNIERQVQDSLYRSVQIEQMEENLDNMKRNMQLIRERLPQKTRGRVAVIGSGPAGLAVAGDLAGVAAGAELDQGRHDAQDLGHARLATVGGFKDAFVLCFK